MGMLQTDLKILKQGRDVNHAISHFYGMIHKQLEGADYEKINIFEVKDDNFDEVMDRQETYAQDDWTKESLKKKMNERRLVCVEIDW
jgi:hypothetical protein